MFSNMMCSICELEIEDPLSWTAIERSKLDSFRPSYSLAVPCCRPLQSFCLFCRVDLSIFQAKERRRCASVQISHLLSDARQKLTDQLLAA